MATGQPGFGDSLFKLASQRQAALSAEQARVTNQQNIRRRDIDKLSGFNASLIEGDQQRSIFEDAVADVQSYIAGTGQYEDSEYDPVNFRAQVAKINSLYNGFKGHNEGDVNVAQQSLYDDAYTEGGREIGRENGVVMKSNNNPTSYDEAVASHNNYFESYTVDGKVQYDENGHPMGFPVIDGVVDRSKPASSIFKMEAYSNPENFKGNTVEQPIPSLYDMSVTAQSAIQQKQGVVDPATGALYPLSEVSDDYFDNAINNPDFLEGAIRDIAGDKLNITDEQMKAYINGEEKVDDGQGGDLRETFDGYVAKAKEEWSNLTAYGRTGSSGAESPFTGNTFEHTLAVTTGEDLNGVPIPQEDSVSNSGPNIKPIKISSGDHGNYTVTGILGAAIGGGAEGGGEGMYVMIPQEVEMLKLPDGSIIPMDQATEDQLTALGGGHAGYSTIDVTDNEMVRIDGDNADPRSREILDNLKKWGITERDFQINSMQNQERFLEVKAERQAQAAAQAEIDAANADVPPEETTEVGTGEPIPDDPAAVARDNAFAAAAAADLLENDSDATPEEKEAANARAEEARIEAEAVADGIAEEDISTADAELDASEASQAQSEENVAATNARIQAERNRSVGGMLRNLVSLGPIAAYNLYQAGEEQEAADVMAEENTGQGEAQTKLRERLLAEEAAMLETEAEALRETTPTPLRDSQEIEENVLSNFALNSPERELAEEVINSTPPASTGINDLASNPDSNTSAIISDMEGVLEGTSVDEDGNPVIEMDAETAALIAAEDTAAGEAHSKAMQAIISRLGGVDFLGDEKIQEFNDQVRGIMEHVMGEGYMTPLTGGWAKDVAAKKETALKNYVSNEQKRISKGKEYDKLSKKKKAEYDGVRAKGEEAMAAAEPGKAGGALSYDTAPNWCAAWVSNIILNKNPNYNLNAELAVDTKDGKVDKYNRIRATSFQSIGEAVFSADDEVGSLEDAQVGDVITKRVLKKGRPVGSTADDAYYWHVGFYAGVNEDGEILILGGNQNDSVNISPESASEIASIRRVQLSGDETLTGEGPKKSLLSQEEIEAVSSIVALDSSTETQ